MTLLKKYGADERTVTVGDRMIGCEFRVKGWAIRQLLTIPPMDNLPGYASSARISVARNKHEQTVRTRWRLLILVIKTKFELMLETGLPVEQVFFGELLLPSGETTWERAESDIAVAKETGQLPESILPSFGSVIALGAGNHR